MCPSKGLDEQAYCDTETWHQAFLSGAADMFHSITALNLEADAAGFELSEEDQAQLDAIAQSLDATADYYGMESGLAYLQASFGPKATVEDYVAFARDNLRASRYLEKLMDEMEFTDAEISDYYDQNADPYAENRVEKIDKPMVNVRHILIEPEAAEDGTISDEAWAAAGPSGGAAITSMTARCGSRPRSSATRPVSVSLISTRWLHRFISSSEGAVYRDSSVRLRPMLRHSWASLATICATYFDATRRDTFAVTFGFPQRPDPLQLPGRRNAGHTGGTPQAPAARHPS